MQEFINKVKDNPVPYIGGFVVLVAVAYFAFMPKSSSGGGSLADDMGLQFSGGSAQGGGVTATTPTAQTPEQALSYAIQQASAMLDLDFNDDARRENLRQQGANFDLGQTFALTDKETYVGYERANNELGLHRIAVQDALTAERLQFQNKMDFRDAEYNWLYGNTQTEQAFAPNNGNYRPAIPVNLKRFQNPSVEKVNNSPETTQSYLPPVGKPGYRV
jgi:hypothetical protein